MIQKQLLNVHQKQYNIAAKVHKKYSEADVFIMKSHSNNCSLPLLGAMQAM